MNGEPHAYFGAGERSRTLDLRITNALLYQLSYTGLFTQPQMLSPRPASPDVMPLRSEQNRIKCQC